MQNQQILFTNVNVIAPRCVQKNSSVLISDGKIKDIARGLSVARDFRGQIIDGKGAYLSPGFIDIHCHGGGGHDFMDASPEAFIGVCEMHARFGTTTILPTIMPGGQTELNKIFAAYHQVKNMPYNGARMPGLHLEGPYISLEYRGAQSDRYIRTPESSDYERIYESSDGCIARWSVAPELPGGFAFGCFLREKGILPAIAHSGAAYDEVLAAYKNGFNLITHLYSGMSSIVRVNGFRVPGVVESTYLIDGMYAELIADGCHLPVALLELAYKIKGADQLVLVTDAMRGADMPDGESILGSLTGGQPVYIEKDVAYLPDRQAFAGSVCTADRLLRTMVEQVKVPLCEAVTMLTETPAKLLNLTELKGSIEPSKDADLVLLDHNLTVQMTMVGGNIVFEKERMSGLNVAI